MSTLLAASSLLLVSFPAQANQQYGSANQERSGMEAVRLSNGRIPSSESKEEREVSVAPSTGREREPTPYRPGEFEAYVNQLLSTGTKDLPAKRLGAELMTPATDDNAPHQIPLDYVIGIGDEVQLTLWGSVGADLHLSVDNAGRIVVPRVGPILVAGLRYAELSDTLHKRVAQVFGSSEYDMGGKCSDAQERCPKPPGPALIAWAHFN